MKKYKCIDDLQNANFMVGEIKTLEEWRKWAVEKMLSTLREVMHYEGTTNIEKYAYYNEVMRLSGDEVIPYIEKIYEIKIEEV